MSKTRPCEISREDAFFVPNDHREKTLRASRPPLAGQGEYLGGLYFGGGMTEQELKEKTGELLLEASRIKLREQGILRKKEMSDRSKVVAVIIWIALIVLTILALFYDTSHAVDCSYYSVESLKREGTWKTSKGRMANNEYFKDDLMCCATRLYALGDVLRITDPSTHKSVVAVVTDRIGKRFAKTRIDLSPRAFSSLASLEQGIIKNVTVEVL